MPWDSFLDLIGVVAAALIGATIPALMVRSAKKDARAVRISMTTNNGGSTMLDRVDAIYRTLGESAVRQQEQSAKLDTHILEEREARSRLAADVELIKINQLSVHA